MKPIKTPGPLSLSPKPKRTPLHSALRTDYACSRLSPEELRRIYVEGRPVKATNRGQPWKEAEQLNSTDFFQRIHHYFDEIGASTRMRQEFSAYHAGKQAKKQEKLARKRPRKQPDHADQWTEQQWSQRTWNVGWGEGWREPASTAGEPVTCLQKTHQFLVPEIEPETTPIKHT